MRGVCGWSEGSVRVELLVRVPGGMAGGRVAEPLHSSSTALPKPLHSSSQTSTQLYLNLYLNLYTALAQLYLNLYTALPKPLRSST